MNKKLIISYGLIAALTLSVAAMIIGCNTKKNPPDEASGSLNGSVSQTFNGSDNSEDPNAEGTFDISGTNETGGMSNPSENETGGTESEDPSVAVGVTDGSGGRDPDEDDPVNPGTPTSPSTPTNPSTPTSPSTPTDPSTPTNPSTPTTPTEPTQPGVVTPQGEDPLAAGFDIELLTFEHYYWGLTSEQQKAVIDMFATPEDFVKWYNAMAAQYKAEHPDIEIGDGGIVDLNP